VSGIIYPRPLLKWVGGKTQIVDELLNRIPLYFSNYHEPFLGGGALFFKLYRQHKIRKAFLSDINAELIDTYISVRDYVDDVIKLLSIYPHDEKFFYELRSRDPWLMSLPERAARMIYLNKTGYNGLYRVNKRGQFNVPFGRYKSPDYCNVDNLRAVSQSLKDVEIFVAPFETVLENAKPGDLVYFDPPYAPISKTANFTAYHATGFTSQDQEHLKDVCLQLTRQNVSVLLSNSNADVIRSLYSTRFTVNEILASRSINCNGSRRGKLIELIITNYPMKRAAQLRLLEKRAPYLLTERSSNTTSP